MPLVSIVLPTYNGTRFLAASISSCLGQTFADLELIVVDDGSGPGVKEIVDRFVDSRIVYIRKPVNRGLPSALNTGFAAARGELFTWTSDDNEYEPEAIAQMVSELQAHPEVGLVYADYWSSDERTGVDQPCCLSAWIDLSESNTLGACFMYRRQVYRRIGGYRESLACVEDYEYWIRATRYFAARHIGKLLYRYRYHASALTVTRRSDIVLLQVAVRYIHGFADLATWCDAVAAFVYRTVNAAGKRAALNAVVSMAMRVFAGSFAAGAVFLGVVCSLAAAKVLRPLIAAGERSWSWAHDGIDYALFSHRLRMIEPDRGRTCVLFVVPYLVMGGAEQVVLTAAAALPRERFSVYALTTVPARNVWRDRFRQVFAGIMHARPRSQDMIAQYRYVRAVVQRMGCRVAVVSNSALGYASVARLKADCPGIACADILHTTEGIGCRERWLSAAAVFDTRICVSELIRDSVRVNYARWGIPQELTRRLAVIPNGVDCSFFDRDIVAADAWRNCRRIGAQVKVVVFVGRLEWEKAPDRFVAISEVLRRTRGDDTILFVMAGNGSMMWSLRRSIRSKGLDGYFVMEGACARDRLRGILAAADVVLAPSRTEGFPLSVLEAMAMAVPVVAADVGGVGEIISNGKNGFLVKPGVRLVDDFCATVLRLFSDDGLRREIARNARLAVVERFDARLMAERYRDAVEEMCGRE